MRGQCSQPCALASICSTVSSGMARNASKSRSQIAGAVEAEALGNAALLCLLALVLLGVVFRNFLIVAGQRLVGGVGNALFQHLQVEHAEQRVAAADLRVEEAERQAGLHRLDPERDLGQFDRHRVAVHAVEAAAGDIAQRVAKIGQRRRALGADAGNARGDTARGGEQEMARTARGVDDA